MGGSPAAVPGDALTQAVLLVVLVALVLNSWLEVLATELNCFSSVGSGVLDDAATASSDEA